MALAFLGCGDNGQGGSTPTPDATSDATPDAVINPPPDPLEGQCRTQIDCGNFGNCLAPGQSAGCGICQNVDSTCETDADCAPATSGTVCNPVACACSAANSCTPGCSTNGCGEAEVCNNATERCTGAPCSGNADCPASFTCTASQCVRTTCSDDETVCRGDYCVLGACFATPGTCSLPVP